MLKALGLQGTARIRLLPNILYLDFSNYTRRLIVLCRLSDIECSVSSRSFAKWSFRLSGALFLFFIVSALIQQRVPSETGAIFEFVVDWSLYLYVVFFFSGILLFAFPRYRTAVIKLPKHKDLPIKQVEFRYPKNGGGNRNRVIAELFNRCSDTKTCADEMAPVATCVLLKTIGYRIDRGISYSFVVFLLLLLLVVTTPLTWQILFLACVPGLYHLVQAARYQFRWRNVSEDYRRAYNFLACRRDEEAVQILESLVSETGDEASSELLIFANLTRCDLSRAAEVVDTLTDNLTGQLMELNTNIQGLMGKKNVFRNDSI